MELVKDLFNFEAQKLVAITQDAWGQKAVAWYEQVKDTPYQTLSEVQKGWLIQIKFKLDTVI